ncbi:MAG TPA: hypothetical protein DHW78_07500 [Ruminococcaceae bacterium]|nr:hypothetical protein [Oscillospiraceae bacterium]HCC02373.1 hypothetical protein [Oscillospiraceae bacterium]HCM24150.1 hypothetical protein [Oscillospiraceae bacterium]
MSICLFEKTNMIYSLFIHFYHDWEKSIENKMSPAGNRILMEAPCPFIYKKHLSSESFCIF